MGSEISAFLGGAIIAFFLGAIAGLERGDADWEKVMIDRELAIYCPLDGHFAFIKDGCSFVE